MDSKGEREIEKPGTIPIYEALINWDRAAKGRGNRWRMLRDIVALTSVKPMNIMMIQDCMLKMKGLTRNKVRELTEDLERAAAIKQTSGNISGVGLVHGWVATDPGVSYWLKNRKAIPAGIVEVASRMQYAVRSEV